MLKFFILFLLTSCAWSNLQQHYANRELSRITNEFKKIAEKRRISLPTYKFHFVDMKDVFPKSNFWAGACAKNNNIYLDKRWWTHSHSLDKEQVVFHELGHCALGLKHGTGLMAQQQIEFGEYLENKEKLIEELFDIAKK